MAEPGSAQPTEAELRERFLASIKVLDNGVHESSFTVVNTMGLHVRPATNLMLAADKYSDTEIWLVKDGVEVSAKEALLILTLAGVCGTLYQLRARGPQAEQALTEILSLAARRFDVVGD